MNSGHRNSTRNGNLSNNILSNNNVLPTNINNCQNPNNCANDNLQDILCNYLGWRCSCEFDTLDGLETRSGTLERIGNDYLALRTTNSNGIVYCNTSNLRFVSFMC